MEYVLITPVRTRTRRVPLRGWWGGEVVVVAKHLVVESYAIVENYQLHASGAATSLTSRWQSGPKILWSLGSAPGH